MSATRKGHKVVSRVPGFGTVPLIALIFLFPLMVWGDRFPWLVAFPVAAIVFITARSEWARMRTPAVQEAPIKVEITLETRVLATADMADFFWQPVNKSSIDEWMNTVRSQGRITPKTYCPDKRAERNEGLLAVA